MAAPGSDPNAIDQSKTYTVKELAALLNFTVNWTRDLIHQGKIESFKPIPGGHIRIRGSEVARILGSIKQQGAITTAGEDEVDEILVPPENAARIFPREAEPDPTGEDLKIGFHHLFE